MRLRITDRRLEAALRQVRRSRWGSRSVFKESDLRRAAERYAAGLEDDSRAISMDQAAAEVPCSRQYLRNYILTHNMPIRRKGNPGKPL